MKDEIQSALTFLSEKLKDTVDEKNLENFKNNLLAAMLNRFENHWHPEKPLKGNAFRCLNIEEGKLDPFLKEVVLRSGLTTGHFTKVFPHGLALWIDPNDVSYRLGKGTISPIYRRFDKPSKSTSLNVHSPSFKPRLDQRIQTSQPQTNMLSRFTPPPGFTSQNVERERSPPLRLGSLASDFSTTWSLNSSFPADTWNENPKAIRDGASDLDMLNFLSHGRSVGFQNFPQNIGWKTYRKGRPSWNNNSLSNANIKQDRFNRFHWYKDEQLSHGLEKPLDFKGIPQEVY